MNEKNLISSNRGGKREGAGRPKGSTKEPTVTYYRRVKSEWVVVLDRLLNELKEQVK